LLKKIQLQGKKTERQEVDRVVQSVLSRLSRNLENLLRGSPTLCGQLADRYIVIPLNQHHKQRTGQLRETGTMMASQSLAISCLERRINSQVICSRRWLLVAPITIHRESPHMLFKMFGRTFDEDCSSALQTESHSITTRHYALTLG